MAENCIQFDEEIEDLTPEEEKWWIDWIGEEVFDNKEAQRIRAAFEAQSYLNIPRRDLRIRSEGSGDVQDTALMVQEFLSKFRPSSCFWLRWAESCDSPRVGEGKFGGGAVFVTATSCVYLNVEEFIQQEKEKWLETTGRRKNAGR